LEELKVSLDEDYPKQHTNHVAALGRLLAQAPDLDPGTREDVAIAMNEVADKASDLLDILRRLLHEEHSPAEAGELLIAFELTTEQIRGQSDTFDGKLYEIGDRLKAAAPTTDRAKK
jgi:hypothetical protein